MNKLQKFLLVLVVGLMLVTPFGAARLAAPAQLTAQPASSMVLANSMGISWPVGGCGGPGFFCPQVNWNS